MLPVVSPSKLGTLLVMIVVALASFGLGYMAAQDSTRTPIIIEKGVVTG